MKEQLSDPIFTDQIIVFRHLTIDELTKSINEQVFSIILEDKYDKFLSICNDVIGNPSVDNVSCVITSDGELKFDITYKA